MQQYFSNQVYVFCFHPWESNRGAFLILKTIKLDRILWGNFFWAVNSAVKDNDPCEKRNTPGPGFLTGPGSGPWHKEQEPQPRQQSHWAEEVEGRAGHQGRRGCISPRLKAGLCMLRPRHHAIYQWVVAAGLGARQDTRGQTGLKDMGVLIQPESKGLINISGIQVKHQKGHVISTRTSWHRLVLLKNKPVL